MFSAGASKLADLRSQVEEDVYRDSSFRLTFSFLLLPVCL
jgi:hypothetical protein